MREVSGPLALDALRLDFFGEGVVSASIRVRLLTALTPRQSPNIVTATLDDLDRNQSVRPLIDSMAILA